MRVALVLGTSTGGVGQHVRSLVERLPHRGVAVTVLGPAETDALFGFAAAGAAFRPVRMTAAPRPWQDLRAIKHLRRELAPFDVVHAHGLRAAAFAGMALRGPRRPPRPGDPGPRPALVATWHNAVLARGVQGRVLVGLETLAARSADLTLGASEDLVERALALGAAHARLGPVAARPLPEPERDASAVRAELGCINRSLVLAVGRLAPQKDYPTMLSAAALWRDLAEPPLLAVAGDGPLQESMQRRIEDEQLPVRLLGRVADVASLFAAADLAVLTSTWEARALVAQEALRAGVPLVATAVGGIPGLVGDAAVLVPPHSPEAVSSAVVGLLDDPRARADLVARGYRQAAAWPDEDGTADDVVAAYHQARGEPAPH